MYRSTGGIDAAGEKTVRVQKLDFRPDEAFVFLCNPDVNEKGWTPSRLFEEKNITDFGQLQSVVVFVTTRNFDHALLLVEAWLESGYAVKVEFPILPQRPRFKGVNNPRFLGMDIESCYRPTKSGGWTAAREFREFVREIYSSDKAVHVADTD